MVRIYIYWREILEIKHRGGVKREDTTSSLSI